MPLFIDQHTTTASPTPTPPVLQAPSKVTELSEEQQQAIEEQQAAKRIVWAKEWLVHLHGCVVDAMMTMFVVVDDNGCCCSLHHIVLFFSL